MNKHEFYRQTKLIAPTVVLSLMLLLSACTTFRLLAVELPPLPNDEELIKERINSSFAKLFQSSQLRITIESNEPFAFPLEPQGGLTLTAPFLLEIAEIRQATGQANSRLVAKDIEMISIISDTTGKSETWLKSATGWEPFPYGEVGMGLLMMSGAGHPYAVIWDPPHNLTFRSRSIGYQNTAMGIIEVYEIQRGLLQSDGTFDLNQTTQIWLDVASSLPILSTSENFTLTYELDDSIKIGLPGLN